MVWQLADSMTHSLPASRCFGALVLWCVFSQIHTGPQHSHSLDTQGLTASHNPDSLQSWCSHTQMLLTNWSQIPGREALRLLALGVGRGVIHICCRERFFPSNWPWARQQVVLVSRRGVDPESHSGSSDLPLPPPHRRPGRKGEFCSSQASSFAPHWGYHQKGGRSLRASP